MISYDSLSDKLKIALSDAMTPAQQAKAITDAIIAEAQTIWGEKWLPNLVNQYCQIESQEAGKTITQVQRRSQLVRALDVGNPTLETLMRLMACVGMTLEASIVRKEIKRFKS